jgi:hypothetical protein
MGSPVVIASVSFDDESHRYPKIDLEQANANARLIAAAPELLEALEGIVKLCDANGFDRIRVNREDKDGPRLSAAKAAIAKAKGSPT